MHLIIRVVEMPYFVGVDWFLHIQGEQIKYQVAGKLLKQEVMMSQS